jgi:hypothetical protein
MSNYILLRYNCVHAVLYSLLGCILRWLFLCLVLGPGFVEYPRQYFDWFLHSVINNKKVYSNITRSPILCNLAICDYWSIKKNKQASHLKLYFLQLLEKECMNI